MHTLLQLIGCPQHVHGRHNAASARTNHKHWLDARRRSCCTRFLHAINAWILAAAGSPSRRHEAVAVSCESPITQLHSYITNSDRNLAS